MTSTAESLIPKHPFQRLSSPARQASALLHVTGLLSFAASFRYLTQFPNFMNESYGWHMQYLTIIGLALATATFSFGLLADALLSSRLFSVKNSLSVTSTPLEVLISTLYWGIRAIDKRLLIPEGFDLPVVPDLGFHAVPTILLLIDLLFFSPPWTISTFPALGVSGSLAFGYWIWIEQCYKHNGWYPYPLLDAMSAPARGALFTGSALMMTLSTLSLKWVYERINGVSRIQDQPGTEKS